MTTINYKKVKCPKCGKSYFRVKDSSGFVTLAFIIKPEPIYKDGELQNPTEAEPIKERCECLECGCNFRVETHDVFGDYRFIDEDEELEKKNERIKELQTENEKLKATLAMAEEHFHEPLPFVNEFDIAIRETEKQGGKKLRDAIINVMSNRNYMGVSYKWTSFSDNDIDSIFNEVFNNDKKQEVKQ